MKKFIIALIIFIVGLVLFMPKINLYYTLETILQKEHIKIDEKKIVDSWILLDIVDADIFYDGIEAAKIKEIKFYPWLIYNKVKIYDLKTSSALKQFLQVNAKDIDITYSIFSYKTINIKADGEFGKLNGEVDLIGRKVLLILEPNRAFKNSKVVREFFKKSKEGLVYESKF